EPRSVSKNGGWLIRPPEQRARTQGRLLPRGVFSLDAGFSIRVTPQQPKLLCSSQLGETCPYPPDAVGGVLFGWERVTAVYRCKHAKAAPKCGLWQLNIMRGTR